MLRYDIKTGVSKIKTKTAVVISAIALSASGLGMAVVVPAVSHAAPNNASSCGAAHGAFANVNGNFGFLGEVGGTPGYHNGATGQDAGATGFNNSHTDCQQ
jgi:hypothetical protein